MIEEEHAKGGLDFEALRDAIDGARCGPLLGFYSEDAELRVVNAATRWPRLRASGRLRSKGTCAPSATRR